MMHLHPFFAGHVHIGLAVLFVIILLGMLAGAQPSTGEGSGVARLVVIGCVVLFLFALCGCTTVVERPDDPPPPPNFCQRHAEGCATAAVIGGAALVFTAMAIEHGHGRPQGDQHATPIGQCVGAQCVQ